MATDPKSAITPAKVDYATPGLDTEAEVIAAFNATNAKINEIINLLVELKIIVG